MEHWKTVRIFVSSTFRDMHAERDHLVRFVFPELREKCAERQLHLVDVDLRWGVTEEEAESGEVLGICLDEIERCRPFFVGILGERYGWVPDRYDVEDQAKYDWLRQFGTGHSVTALEIFFGVVENLGMRGHAFFYFRDPAFLADLPQDARADFEAESEASRTKLANLKDQIRQYYKPAEGNLFENYPCAYDGIGEDGKVRLKGLEAFGERVLANLWGAIEAEYPADAEKPDELAMDRGYHEGFIASRTKCFIGRGDLLEKLADFADGTEPGPLVVTGKPGSGKSALLARFVQDYTRDHPDVFVLAHFVGAAPGSADIRKTLQRLCRELARQYELTDAIPEEPEALRKAFAALLEKAGGRGRLVLLLDALNQLSEGHHARRLDWLPHRLPISIRVVVSTLEGDLLDRLRARSPAPPEVEVGPLTRDDCRDIVRQTLAEYRKRLAERPDDPKQDQLGLLLAKPDAGNPLYLAVACEELRLFGQFEQITQRVRTLAGSVPELFEQVLARLERDHGKTFVCSALSLLACSREGLLEGELLELLRPEGAERLPRAVWARFYRSLQPFLRPPGESGEELVDFFHGQLEQAVRQRYLASEGFFHAGFRSAAASRYGVKTDVAGRTAADWHRMLADYVEGRGDTYPRMLADGIFRLVGAADADRLRRWLQDGFLHRKLARGYSMSEVEADFSLARDFFRDRSDVANMLLVSSARYSDRGTPQLFSYESFLVWKGAVLAGEDDRAEIARVMSYLDAQPPGRECLRMAAELLIGLGRHPLAAAFRQQHRRALERAATEADAEGLDILACEALERVDEALALARRQQPHLNKGRLSRILKLIRRHRAHPASVSAIATLLELAFARYREFGRQMLWDMVPALGLLSTGEEASRLRSTAAARLIEMLDLQAAPDNIVWDYVHCTFRCLLLCACVANEAELVTLLTECPGGRNATLSHIEASGVAVLTGKWRGPQTLRVVTHSSGGLLAS